jgi:hypothetical protein
VKRRQLGQIRQALARWFSKEELLTLAFDLGLSHEDLPTGHDSLTRELVAACRRQDSIPELLALAQSRHPDRPWETVAPGFPRAPIPLEAGPIGTTPARPTAGPIDNTPLRPTGARLVASKRSDRYHRLGCPSAARIKPENRIYFSSAAAARASGKLPCLNCQPPT